MKPISALVIAALVFGVCFLLDKLFAKLFRSQAQHHSGTAVRLPKSYAVAGLLLLVLSGLLLWVRIEGSQVLPYLCAGILAMLGLGLTLYYLTYGIFYNETGFLFTPFLQKGRLYRYSQIRGQLLYRTNNAVLIELHMDDGTTVTVHSNMPGAYPFLDRAFAVWKAEKGLTQCPFHDPDNHLWFPTAQKEVH